MSTNDEAIESFHEHLVDEHNKVHRNLQKYGSAQELLDLVKMVAADLDDDEVTEVQNLMERYNIYMLEMHKALHEELVFLLQGTQSIIDDMREKKVNEK